MLNHRSTSNKVVRRKGPVGFTVEGLEPRTLLSTIATSLPRAPVLQNVSTLQVAPVQTTTSATLQAAPSATSSLTYFLALGIPSGVRTWVSNHPQSHIKNEFKSKVTVIRPLHVSLVRNIGGINNLKSFEAQVTGVVKNFEKAIDRSIAKAFEFKPTTGLVQPLKQPGFYVYHLSPVGYSSNDFTNLAKKLAALNKQSAPESASSAHMSVFYNWSADTAKIAAELQKCCQEHLHSFHAEDVMLVESLGNHEYKVIKSWK